MRNDYDHRDYARGYDHHSYGARGYQMGPGWGWRDRDDPNWRNGEYGGMRMRGDARHPADYGRYRFFHQQDLGGYGGFDGRYDLPEGYFDREGYYHEEGGAERQGLRPRYTPFPPRSRRR